MYGAILRKHTELVHTGEAHIGVLFMHNCGFSTMCGHATIALGRFLIDTHDEDVFPNRSQLLFDKINKTATIKLHAPCGVVTIIVPTNEEGTESDSRRPVSFLSAPSFPAAIGLELEIPKEVRWKELGDKKTIKGDLSYGGTFYVLVTAEELGFTNGLRDIKLADVTSCMKKLRPYLASHPKIVEVVQRTSEVRLSFLYSVMIIDQNLGVLPENASSAETGLCFFADNEIDRSPTGSCVSARVALAHAKGKLSLKEKRAHNSIISNHFKKGSLIGSVTEELENSKVIVRFEGHAYYTGSSTFIWEEDDLTSSEGFVLESCL